MRPAWTLLLLVLGETGASHCCIPGFGTATIAEGQVQGLPGTGIGHSRRFLMGILGWVVCLCLPGSPRAWTPPSSGGCFGIHIPVCPPEQRQRPEKKGEKGNFWGWSGLGWLGEQRERLQHHSRRISRQRGAEGAPLAPGSCRGPESAPTAAPARACTGNPGSSEPLFGIGSGLGRTRG